MKGSHDATTRALVMASLLLAAGLLCGLHSWRLLGFVVLLHAAIRYRVYQG